MLMKIKLAALADNWPTTWQQIEHSYTLQNHQEAYSVAVAIPNNYNVYNTSPRS